MPTRRHIRLTWVASAESVVAEMLDDEAPQVCELIWQLLPVEHKSIHGQFSGAEVFVLLDKPQPAPPENLCQLPLPGELLYFFDPGGNVTSGTRVAAEICLIYNRGVVLRGPEGAPTHASLVTAKYGDQPPRQPRPNANRGDNVTGPSPYQDTGSPRAGASAR